MHRGSGSNKGFASAKAALVAYAMLAGGCTDAPAQDGGGLVEVTGRVFSQDKELPLAGARVVGPSGKSADTADDGNFEIAIDSSKKGSVTATSVKTAPVSKPAPTSKAHLELHAKEFDAQTEIDLDAGGEAKTKEGAGISIAQGQLASKTSTNKDKVVLSVAVPDTDKSSGLQTLPGNFDAKKAGKSGKLATESAVYVSARQGEDELTLKDGSKATLSLKGPGTKQKASDLTLYRFDEVSGTWTEVSQARSELDGSGLPVYRGEVAGFGWFAVGEFYDSFACVRGCIAGESAGVRVLATGVDHPSQAATFTDEDGCFAVNLRTNSRYGVSAQDKGRAAPPAFVQTAGEGSSVPEASACSAVDSLVLQAASDSCALGLGLCAASCVDLAFDSQNCGSCGTTCVGEATCLVGQCVEPGGVPTTDAGPVGDGGVQPGDAGSTQPDGSTAFCDDLCSSDPMIGPFEFAGCCTPGGSCGFFVDQALRDLGFSYECIARDQPGVSSAVCPSLSHESSQGTLELPGCCRDDNNCGYDTGSLDYAEFASADGGAPFIGNVALPLGCIRADQAVPGAMPRSCTHAAGDNDGDGIPNDQDSCPEIADIKMEAGVADMDGDQVGDVCDNCIATENNDQTDTDQDGTGDACDSDLDGDQIANVSDNCPAGPNTNQSDVDGDLVGDICDTCPQDGLAAQDDQDRDGAGDACDNCPAAPNADQMDENMNGFGDVCEIF